MSVTITTKLVTRKYSGLTARDLDRLLAKLAASAFEAIITFN